MELIHNQLLNYRTNTPITNAELFQYETHPDTLICSLLSDFSWNYSNMQRRLNQHRLAE